MPKVFVCRHTDYQLLIPRRFVMMSRHIAVICGIGIAFSQGGFGQEPLAPSLHEAVAALENTHGINPFQARVNALRGEGPNITSEMGFPTAFPRTETVSSTPISLSRLKHKVPRPAKSAFQKAWKLDQEGKTERALEEFRRAVTLDPDFADAHCDLGALYQRLGKYAAAEDEFRRGVALAPELSGMRSNLGWALAAQGKIAEAEASARQALRMWSGNYNAHQLLGRILAAAPETRPEAIEHLEAAVKLLSSVADRPSGAR